MNYLRFAPVLILVLSACGGGSSVPGAATTIDPVPGLPTVPALPVWRVEVDGDGTTFALSMITDQGLPTEQQVTQGPAIAVPAGSVVAYTATGYSFTSGAVMRTGGVDVGSGGNWQYIRLYKDGVQVESGALSTSGTTNVFSSH